MCQFNPLSNLQSNVQSNGSKCDRSSGFRASTRWASRAWVGAVALAVLMNAVPAFATFSAALTTSSIGPVSVGRDTVGGLDWLKLDYTLGLTYQQVLGGTVTSSGSAGYSIPSYTNDWIADGWSYATTTDLCNLVALYVPGVCPGISPFTYTNSPPNPDPLEVFKIIGQGCVGMSLPFGGHVNACGWGGLFDDGGGPLVGLVQIGATELNGPILFGSGSLSILTDGVLDTVPPPNGGLFPYAGSYLVRPIPEPSVAVLLGAGLLGIGTHRRRTARC